MRGVGAVEDSQVEEARSDSERLAANFRAETAAAHAEQKRVRETGLANFLSESSEGRALLAHRFRSAQPAEAVADGGGGFFVALPQCGVFCPEALGEVLLLQASDALADGGLVLAQ